MTEEEMKAAIQEAVEEATSGLKKKNSELIGDIKKLQSEKESAAERAEEAAEEAARASGDLAKLEETLAKKYQKQIDALTFERDQASNHLNTLLVDNTISKALVENNVPAHLHEPLTALFKQKSTVKEGKALIGDDDLSEHLNQYFASDTGKHFVSAPQNSGSGATGSERVNGTSLPKTWNLTWYAKMKEENPELAKTYWDNHHPPKAD